MELHTLTNHPLTPKDIDQAITLDQKWFGDHAVSTNELEQYIADDLNRTIGIFNQSALVGFATFEFIETSLPKDYVGNIKPAHKTLFIHQFTTITNYSIQDSSVDLVLLKAVQQKAYEFGCEEVWEALAIDHPYSKSQNPQFDAFGFYTDREFIFDTSNTISWQPNPHTHIPCYLFKKII